jgi:hypothetical protein
MSQSPIQPGGANTPPSVLDRLAANPRQVGIAVGVAGLLLAIIPIYLYARSDSLWPVWPVFTWGLCVSLVALAHAAAFLVPMDGAGRLGQMTPTERVRAYLFSLGGVLGALTAVLGLLLPFTQYSEVFGSDLKVWRQSPGALVLTALALFGGLTLIFVTFQLARGVQRSSVLMRRFLYLYNAVFSSLLLLFILILFNVLALSHVGAFEFFTTNYDWTSYGIYTLSPKSKALLTSLDQPVKVYVLMTNQSQVIADVETLLDNCRSVTNKVSYEMLSRDLNRKDIMALLEKYPVTDLGGLLVVYGTEPNAKWDYVKPEDLSKSPPMGSRDATPTFTGENALMKTIDYLSQDKTKPVIYFTQGNGEPDLNERRGDAADQGLGALSEQIGKGNYEVKPLTFGPDFKAIPEDAAVVVMVRPGSAAGPVPENAVRALRDYLNGAGGKKKGKLMVLLDVLVQPNGSMVRTGLEELLEEYQVKLGNNRILCADGPNPRNPTLMIATANPDSQNPIAKAFFRSDGVALPLGFDDARSVEPKAGEPGGRYTAESLVQTYVRELAWAENDLTAQPAALVAALRKDPEKLAKTISRTAISLAVAVTEGKAPAPMPPGHPPVGGDQQPRLIVFGDASWVTNRLINSQIGAYNYDLFSNCLSWLRERPDIGAEYAEGKIRENYTLDAKPDVVSRLRWLPFGLMLLGLFGAGGAVWVVRRR